MARNGRRGPGRRAGDDGHTRFRTDRASPALVGPEPAPLSFLADLLHERVESGIRGIRDSISDHRWVAELRIKLDHAPIPFGLRDRAGGILLLQSAPNDRAAPVRFAGPWANYQLVRGVKSLIPLKADLRSRAPGRAGP